jgi:N4-gp56 family major capsid protein
MLNYNAPISGTKSSIDGTGSDQMNSFYWLRKSLIEARREQFFMPLASVTNMPKNYGKTIKVYEYVPMLDVRNVNDQGIDASGITIANGNLYGSSKDVGTISSKLPLVGENGGRVNRVGFTRLSREASLLKFGFFYEFTQESMDFDSDDMLKEHLARELMNGATKITEDVLQKDLLASAGVILYAGAATSNGTITGEVVPEVVGVSPETPASILSYKNIMRLSSTLDENRTPKQTTVISGSRYIDTKVIGAGRIAYIGSELAPVVMEIKDPFNNPAFVAVQHYSDAGTILNGEIGSVGPLRFVQVPDMLHWAGVGATVGTNPGYRTTTVLGTEKYDVYPVLVVGDQSFTTIGFQTDGKSVKFTVMTKMPGRETADRNDPYGETGFSSIKWYYGILVTRPERIGLMKSVAPI